MKEVYIKFIETAIVIVTYLIINKFLLRAIKRNLSKKLIQESRGKLISSVINLILLLIFLIFISIIWGVNQSDLVVFVGSALTVVGVAFFAQWSLLSNITSSIIIFFNHPIRLNDSIVILEGKDYGIEGTVCNIGLFFITLRTKDLEEITLPNNIFILKSIKNLTSEKNNSDEEKVT